MPVYINCPACKSTLKLIDNFARKHARCPYCRHVMEVPSPSTETVNAQLDEVGERIRARARALGIEVGDRTDLEELTRLIEAAQSGGNPPSSDREAEFG